MPRLPSAKEEVTPKFSWGCKTYVGGKNKNIQFYDSFTYDGVEYRLYDCIYLWRDGESEPDVGKLVRICKTPSHKKKVMVVWFFRPSEIRNWLGDIKPLKKELFLAAGEGNGLSNVNPLEAVSGKCNVICTSTDSRNTQAAEGDLRRADYIFFRIFDVERYKISTTFPDVIAGIQVEHYFNLRDAQNHSLCPALESDLKAKNESEDSFSAFGLAKATRVVKDDMKITPPGSDKQPNAHMNNEVAANVKQSGKSAELKLPTGNLGKERSFHVKDGTSARVKMKYPDFYSTADVPDVQALKKRKLQDEAVGVKPLSGSHEYKEKIVNARDSSQGKKSLPEGVNISENSNGSLSDGVCQFELDRGMKSDGEIREVTRGPTMDRSNWFRLQSWEDRICDAQKKGTIVLLENLDLCYTSTDVEDIMQHAFNLPVSAKMIQSTMVSSPNYGKALVIFKTKDAADTVISELKEKCLMLSNGRAVVGRRKALGDPRILPRFFGHLSLQKLKFQRQHEDMAQAKEIEALRSQIKVEQDAGIKM